MKRRDLLEKAVAGAAGIVGASALGGCRRDESPAAPAVHTRPHIEGRLVSSFPRGLDTIYGAAAALARRVEEMSSGRFRIRPYPSGEIVPGLQVMDAVQQGAAHVGHTASYYYIGKNPAFGFDTAVPFGLSARQQAAWLQQAGGAELLAPLFAELDIVSFFAGSTGAQMGGWFRNEIHSVADLQGLKMRIPGQGGVVMNRLGVTVQVLAGGDIYPALERGAIDATEWIGPYDDERLGFHKVAKYYYYPGWWEPGASLSFYVHRPLWETLPADYQAIFRCAAAEAAHTMQAQYDARNPAALERLLAAGVELRAFPPDVMTAAQRETDAWLEEHAAADPRFRRVYEPWRAFRDRSFAWFATTERAYADFAFQLPRR